MTQGSYSAVLIAGFGGPEGPDDVMPFLRNVTRGRGVPDVRLEQVADHYRALGGVSPINEQTAALQQALQVELVDRGITLEVLWGNRNWDPYLADTVAAARDAGQHRLLAIATSAYSSYSSCRQYREDFAAALQDADALGTVSIDKIRPYFDLPGFLDPFADGTVTALREALDTGLTPAEVDVVFTTHSIPTAMADSSGSPDLGENGDGGVYVAQHLAACRAVMDRVRTDLVAGIDWQLAYQSRSGSPHTPWLEPDIGQVLADIAAAGGRAAVVVPIGFVTDHVEVIWDLDTEAAQIARELDIGFWRVPTPGPDPRFVAGLADLVAERLGRALPRDPTTALPTRPDRCPPGCCRNLSGRRPTTGGADSVDDWAGIDADAAVLSASGICPMGAACGSGRP